jgi:hypothetical protein
MSRKWAVPRVLGAVAVVLGMLFVAGIAEASRTLWQSSHFSVKGAVVGTKLVLTHTNRTDYFLRFRCKFVTLDGTHKTSGELNPGEVWKTKFRRQDRLPSKTTCRVNVDTSDTIMWRSDDFVVLGKEITLPDGTPNTILYFANETNHKLHMTCSWWQSTATSSQLSPTIWSPVLDPYKFDSLSSGGVALTSIQTFICAPYVQGGPAPITVPPGLTTLFDSGTFLSTQQIWFNGVNNQGSLAFINRLDSAVNASCSWTETWPDGTTHTGTWQQSLNRFGIGGLGTGTSPITGMTCTVTP